MLRPEKIVKIRLLAHKKYYEQLLSELQDAGVMQVEPLSKKFAGVMTQGVQMNHTELDAYVQRFRGLESMLVSHQSNHLFSFEDIAELIGKADSIKIDSRVGEIRKEEDKLSAEMRYSTAVIALLGRMADFKKDLSILNTANISSFAIYGKECGRIEAELEKKRGDTAVIKLDGAIIVSIDQKDSKTLGAMLEHRNVSIEAIPLMTGTVKHNAANERKKLELMQQRSSSLAKELEHISMQYYPLVSAIREQLDMEMEKIIESSKLGSTEATVALEGWIPEKELERIRNFTHNVTNGRYVLQRIKSDELPPTRLMNPKGLRLFEVFIKFYSLPKSTEIDPTVVFALLFPIFFGFMIGDAGYGMVLLLGSLFLLHRTAHIPKKSHMPKALSSFLMNIVSLNGLKTLAKSIIPGSLVAIVFGILFNEYFGFHLGYSTPFNIEHNLTQLLVLSGWVGVSMVGMGFFLGIVNKLAQNDRKHAAAKAGWLIAMVGVVMFGLAVLHRANLGFENIYAIVSYAAIATGVLMIAIFEGAIALMELPSLISHILSYTRLIGILLASVILAEVIDFIFVAGLGKSLLFGILGILILLFGQLFNIVIALFEPGIQGARLFYVEFFSKFYEGNGKEFKPFAYSRRRTLPKQEQNNVSNIE